MKVKNIVFSTAARLGHPYPITLTFELTHLCNLACSYCDRHTPMSNEMSLPQIFKALEQFIQLGMCKVNLDGGEPLAHKHISEIVRWLTDDRGITVQMNSNGILAPRKENVIKRLSKVKISLDGPQKNHDVARGEGAFAKAIAGALAAREMGVPRIEFTCCIGEHNVDSIDELLDLVESLDFTIIFQPVRSSLFGPVDYGVGDRLQLGNGKLKAALANIEQRKSSSKVIANHWSSLRHFRSFPNNTPLPCSAGWVKATMDPAGNLHHCGQIARTGPPLNVVELGAEEAFKRLSRDGCEQCWCARTVEGNYLWGGRLDMFIPSVRNNTELKPDP